MAFCESSMKSDNNHKKAGVDILINRLNRYRSITRHKEEHFTMITDSNHQEDPKTDETKTDWSKK